MKTKKTITVDEYTCDHCGQAVAYSGQYCIVCGKYACSTCFDVKLKSLEFHGPKYFGFTNYAPDVPTCYACPECKSEVTDGMRKLKAMVEAWSVAAAEFRTGYSTLACKVSKAIGERAAQIEGKP
jgi:ferredoxin